MEKAQPTFGPLGAGARKLAHREIEIILGVISFQILRKREKSEINW